MPVASELQLSQKLVTLACIARATGYTQIARGVATTTHQRDNVVKGELPALRGIAAHVADTTVAVDDRRAVYGFGVGTEQPGAILGSRFGALLRVRFFPTARVLAALCVVPPLSGVLHCFGMIGTPLSRMIAIVRQQTFPVSLAVERVSRLFLLGVLCPVGGTPYRSTGTAFALSTIGTTLANTESVNLFELLACGARFCGRLSLHQNLQFWCHALGWLHSARASSCPNYSTGRA